MLKALSASALRLNMGGQLYQEWYGTLDDDIGFPDLFLPTFWMHYKGRFTAADVIRLRRRDGSFDVLVTVSSIADNGDVQIDFYPKYPKDADNASALAAKSAQAQADSKRVSVVPLGKDGKPKVKVEFREACQWRVRGVDGSEVSSNHPSEAKALEAMNKYLAHRQLRMPTAEEIAEAVAEMAAAEAAKTKPKVNA